MNKNKKLLSILISTFLILTPCYVSAEEPESTPEPTTAPEVSPTPSPEPTPEATPEPTPTATPEAEYKISLDKNKLELDAGKSSTLTATVTPDDATVLWESSDEDIATVDSNGKVTAGNKAGTATITAYIEDTDTKAECTVEVTRELGTDATLKSLTISNGSLNKSFKSDVLEYKVTIGENVKSLIFKDLEKDLTDSRAQYWVDGNEKLKDGDVVTIKVQSENGKNTKEYKLTIVKDTVNLNLKSLKINGYALNETFKANTLEYTANIPYEIEVITVQAAAEDSDAKVKVSGNKDLKVGENTVTVTVSDNAGNTKTYKIVVTRDEESTVEEKPTSIITSSDTTDNDKNSSENKNKANDNSNDDSFLKYAIVSLACLILFVIGGIGIYFYLKTSPKKLKKELNKTPVVNDSPVVEVKNEDNSNIQSIMDEKLIETREFQKEDLNKTEDLFDNDKDV